METIKENIAFIFIGIAVLIGVYLPLGDLVQREKFESLKVPRLELPKQLQRVAVDTTEKYPPIEKNVLLGITPEVIAAKQRKSARHGLWLNAIMIDGESRMANINGRSLREGAKIRRHKILKIDEKGVVMEGPKGRLRLTMR